MKKILSAAFCLLLVFSLAMTASATELTATFTPDSLPEVGGTLTVDKNALMDNGSITADLYNALLEGNVVYSWYKNGTLVQEGIGEDGRSYPLTLSDQGCTFYVKISFYEDDSFQESKKCGEVLSYEITVTSPAPQFLTTSLAAATVGAEYYIRLDCSDPDAVFSEIMGSQLSEFGLYLTQHGEIEGVPTKAGNCHINILAVSEGGGENSISYDLTVNAAAAETQPVSTAPASEPTQPPIAETTQPSVPETTQPPATIPAAATGTAPTATEETQPSEPDGSQTFPLWGYGVIAVGGIAVGFGVAYIFFQLKKVH